MKRPMRHLHLTLLSSFPVDELLKRCDNPDKRVAYTLRYKCRRGLETKPSTRSVLHKPQQSIKVGCPWQMTVTCRFKQPGTVQILISGSHHYHAPGSVEDNALLKPDPEVKAAALAWLEAGLRPRQVLRLLDERADGILSATSSQHSAKAEARLRTRPETLKKLGQQILRNNSCTAMTALLWERCFKHTQTVCCSTSLRSWARTGRSSSTLLSSSLCPSNAKCSAALAANLSSWMQLVRHFSLSC